MVGLLAARTPIIRAAGTPWPPSEMITTGNLCAISRVRSVERPSTTMTSAGLALKIDVRQPSTRCSELRTGTMTVMGSIAPLLDPGSFNNVFDCFDDDVGCLIRAKSARDAQVEGWFSSQRLEQNILFLTERLLNGNN